MILMLFQKAFLANVRFIFDAKEVYSLSRMVSAELHLFLFPQVAYQIQIWRNLFDICILQTFLLFWANKLFRKFIHAFHAERVAAL